MPSDQPTAARHEPIIRNPSTGLVLATLSLLAGQALAAAPQAPAPAPFLPLLFLPLPFFYWRRSRWAAALALLSLAAVGVGYARHWSVLHPIFPADHLRSVMREGSQIYLEGVLRQEPEALVGRSRWIVRGTRIWHPTGAQEITGDLLVGVRTVRREWRYGDRVRFWARPLLPRDNGNPGGFDYPAYLARRGIYVTAFLESDDGVELLSRHPAGPWGAIERLRREIRRFLERSFSPDTGALMKALVVGDMGGISRATRAEFTAAGVTHVLSISGLHVGMLGLVVFWLVRFGCSFSSALLLRCNLLKVAAFFSFSAVVFYTALAGAAVPTVRSAIMIGVYELAVLLDREEEVFASLALAALLIGLVWPGVITDISFQLSFLAVLFIVWGLVKAREWFPPRQRDELPQERSWLRHWGRQTALYLAVPLLATIGTGPMIAHYFGNLSLAGFLSNPVIVPLVGFAVVPLGLAVGFLSLVAPPLALPLIWIAEPLASLTLGMVGFFARLPFASIAVPIPNLVEVAGLYLLILSVLLARGNRYAVILLLAVVAGLAADGAYWWRERYRREKLRITHLSVGHGDAAVVELPGSRVLVIDAGGTATGEFDTGEFIVAPFLRARKILRVDLVAVTHPRVDHYGGMRAVLEQFSPLEFWSGPSRGRTSRYEELEEAAERAGVKRVISSSGDPCRAIDRVKLCVLYPPADRSGDASLVLRLTFGSISILFAGDIEGRDERRIIASQLELSSAVLKVPRHGSLSSSTEEFVAAVRPKLAIFSVGQRNPFGLPRDEVLARYRQAGAAILRTDQDGAITIETDGEEVRYWTHKSGKRGSVDRRAVLTGSGLSDMAR
jgi:competence protein ComEC